MSILFRIKKLMMFLKWSALLCYLSESSFGQNVNYYRNIKTLSFSVVSQVTFRAELSTFL